MRTEEFETLIALPPHHAYYEVKRSDTGYFFNLESEDWETFKNENWARYAKEIREVNEGGVFRVHSGSTIFRKKGPSPSPNDPPVAGSIHRYVI